MSKSIKEEFPEEFLNLAREVRFHSNLKLNPADDFEISLAKIAAYCEVVLDGVYTYEDRLEIARKLTDKLYSSRMSLLN